MNDKLLKNINYYGVRTELRKLNEEVFELQEAILYREQPNDIARPIRDFNARLNGKQSPDIEHIAEEIADVQVLLNQFKLYYGISDEELQEYCNSMDYEFFEDGTILN